MPLVVPTGLRAVTLGDDRGGRVRTWDWGWVQVRTEECELRGLGGREGPSTGL